MFKDLFELTDSEIVTLVHDLRTQLQNESLRCQMLTDQLNVYSDHKDVLHIIEKNFKQMVSDLNFMLRSERSNMSILNWISDKMHSQDLLNYTPLNRTQSNGCAKSYTKTVSPGCKGKKK